MSEITAALPPTADGPPPPRAWPIQPNFWWALLACVAAVLLTQVPGGVAAVAVMVGWALLRPGEVPATAREILLHPVGQFAMGLGILVAHGLLILFSLLALRLIAGPKWHREVAWRLPAWHHVPLTAALLPAFAILGGGLYHLLRSLLKVPSMSDFGLPGMEDIEKVMGSVPLPLGVFLIAVMPAFSEELWCRAFLGRGLVGRHGYVFGVLATSFLFGLIHIDPAQGLMAMAMGVALHLVYLWTRSLWMPILLHFLNNGLAVLLTRVPGAEALDKGGGPWHVALFALAGLVLVAGLVALYQGRARLVTPPGEEPWVPEHPGVALPPPESATKVESRPPSWAAVAGLVLGLAGMIYTAAVILQVA